MFKQFSANIHKSADVFSSRIIIQVNLPDCLPDTHGLSKFLVVYRNTPIYLMAVTQLEI